MLNSGRLLHFWSPHQTSRAKARSSEAFFSGDRRSAKWRDWRAGAGGFEPPYGGIKIPHPCLFWRSPNCHGVENTLYFQLFLLGGIKKGAPHARPAASRGRTAIRSWMSPTSRASQSCIAPAHAHGLATNRRRSSGCARRHDQRRADDRQPDGRTIAAPIFSLCLSQISSCRCRKSDPDVTMVQSAEDRQRQNATYRLDRPH